LLVCYRSRSHILLLHAVACLLQLVNAVALTKNTCVLAHLLYAFGVFAVRHSCANRATGDTNHLDMQLVYASMQSSVVDDHHDLLVRCQRHGMSLTGTDVECFQQTGWTRHVVECRCSFDIGVALVS
jgi:hypothetical protein